ncbi:uncharacterized protein LOC119340323 isoform X2 [Triticum dicoccoides]|uniref:uncharacterized protein LOC119340323 isoform X2 n=1 Tax=Triticum dicoccoides TaxID=85692 RepID=UPI001891615D|nr:uncharacterized protein LOC119340323 isoform X2 [Triticum dicoccoides]
MQSVVPARSMALVVLSPTALCEVRTGSLLASSLRDSMALVALLLFLLLRLRRGRALPHRECLRHRRRRRGGSLLPQQQKLRCGYVIVEVQEYVWCLFRFRLGATLQFAWVFTAVRTGVQ